MWGEYFFVEALDKLLGAAAAGLSRDTAGVATRSSAADG